MNERQSSKFSETFTALDRIAIERIHDLARKQVRRTTAPNAEDRADLAFIVEYAAHLLGRTTTC